MKIMWLGQAGLYIETAGKRILIDPYLSDSVEKQNPSKTRRMPVDGCCWALQPDLILCTHDHLDHTDPETLTHFLSERKEITAFAPGSAWERIRSLDGFHRSVLFERHTEWSDGGVRLIAVRAVHSDPQAIGVVLESEGCRLYITGDTLYNTEIFADILPLGHLDAVFVPINGEGNNMNMVDAARFCERLIPDVAVPLHWGTLDDVDGHDWSYPRKLVPTAYQPLAWHSEAYGGGKRRNET